MLVCKLEIWPGGNEAKAREVGRVLITNIGGNAAVGEYDVTIPKSGEYSKRGGFWKRARVSGFPRLRLGPQDLLLRALIACIGRRSTGDVAALGDPNLAPQLSETANAQGSAECP